MLAFPHTPHALLVRKLRRSAGCTVRPGRNATSAMLPTPSSRRGHCGRDEHCWPSQIRIEAMSAALAMMPSLTRKPAVRSMSSPGVRMVRLMAWPPILMPSGSSAASRSARSLAPPACTEMRVTRLRAVRPATAYLHSPGAPRLALAGYVRLDRTVMSGRPDLRSMVANWPAFRQLTGRDRLGRGAAVRSPHTESAAPRTEAADRVVASVCPYCAVGCGQRVYVAKVHGKDTVTQIEGDPDSPVSRGRLCPKGAASKQLVTHPGRLTKVLYRRPYGTAWEPLGLDEAMDMIADRVLATRRATWQELARRQAGPAHARLRQPRRRHARQRGELPHQEALDRARRDPDRESGPHMTLRHRSRSGDELWPRRGDHISPRSR